MIQNDPIRPEMPEITQNDPKSQKKISPADSKRPTYFQCTVKVSVLNLRPVKT